MNLSTIVVPVYGKIDKVDPYDLIEGMQTAYLDLQHWALYHPEELPAEAENCARLNSYLGHVTNGGHGKYLSAILNTDDFADQVDRLVAAAKCLDSAELFDISRQFRRLLENRQAVEQIRDDWGFGEGDKTLQELDSKIFSLSSSELNNSIYSYLVSCGNFRFVTGETYPREIAELALKNEHATERAANWSPYAPNQINELKRYAQLLKKMEELEIGVKRLLMDRDYSVKPAAATNSSPRALRGCHFDSDIGWILVSSDGLYEVGDQLIVMRMPDREILSSFN